MAEHAATPELKRYYLQRWMSIKGLDAFYGAQDALLEQAIYDGVAAGTVRNADDLDKLTLKIDGQFSQFPAVTPELRTRWAMVTLMYEDPLYDVNYVYGGLLALKYYDLYTARPEWFVPRYMALLKNGFNATARGTAQSVPGHRSFRTGAVERRLGAVESSIGSTGDEPHRKVNALERGSRTARSYFRPFSPSLNMYLMAGL